MPTSLDTAPAALAPGAPGPAATRPALVLPAEYLSFRLGDEAYGIDILRVQEIRRYEAPTEIPGAPPYCHGVVNLRGVMVPVVDLRLLLGLDRAPITDATVVIVLTVGRSVIGAVVDAVSDVVAIPPDRVRPAPDLGRMTDTRHLLGLASVRQAEGERLLILTDIQALLQPVAARDAGAAAG